MNSSFLKKVLVVLFLVQTIIAVSQDSKALAKAYLSKAEESFKAKDNSSTEKYLNKSIQYFGENQPKELAYLATKFYVANKKYQRAKKFADLYFKEEKNKNSKEYNEMLLTFIDIEDNIDSGVVVQDTIVTVKKVKKDTLIVSNKPPKKLVKKKGKIVIGKTLRETYLLSKKYFDSKKYDYAKQNLDKFFTLKPKKGTRFYKEMLEVKSKVDKENVGIVEGEKDVKEEVIESTEKGETPLVIIETVPVFPGCSGSKKQKMNCLNLGIRRHIGRKFNADIATNLGLSPGKKKILINFRINKEGIIDSITVNAPHIKLEEEAIRITKLLPKMEPGTQRGIPVGVKFSFPISFNVEAETEAKDN